MGQELYKNPESNHRQHITSNENKINPAIVQADQKGDVTTREAALLKDALTDVIDTPML